MLHCNAFRGSWYCPQRHSHGLPSSGSTSSQGTVVDVTTTAGMSIAECAAKAKNVLIGAAWQSVLARHEDPRIRSVLAKNRALLGPLQEALAVDPLVRAALACNEKLLGPLQVELSRCTDVDVRVALAGNKGLTEEAQRLLATDRDEKVQVALVANSALGARAQATLARRLRVEAAEELAKARHVSAQAQEVLARRGHKKVWGSLARNKSLDVAHLPVKLLMQYAHSRKLLEEFLEGADATDKAVLLGSWEGSANELRSVLEDLGADD